MYPLASHPGATLVTSLPYEILEAILLNLPAQDLLLSQRVCHLFRSICTTSRRIQRALFLEPAHYNPDGGLSSWEHLKWNPFLETALSVLLSIRVIGVHRSAEGLVKMIAHVRLNEEALEDDWVVERFLDKKASWQKMLVTQPPATLLLHPSASLFWSSSMEDEAQFFQDPEGFRILDMVRCVNW